MRREHGPPTAAEASKSPFCLVDDSPASARDHGSEPRVECKHANKLATLQQAAKLAQPPFATKPAEGSNRTPMAM